jgi:hypothetical protein
MGGLKEVPGVPGVLMGPSPVAGEATGGELAVMPSLCCGHGREQKEEMDGPLVGERTREGGVEGN